MTTTCGVRWRHGAIRHATGEPRVSAIGCCLGGTHAPPSTLAAWLAAHSDVTRIRTRHLLRHPDRLSARPERPRLRSSTREQVKMRRGQAMNKRRDSPRGQPEWPATFNMLPRQRPDLVVRACTGLPARLNVTRSRSTCCTGTPIPTRADGQMHARYLTCATCTSGEPPGRGPAAIDAAPARRSTSPG